MPTTYRAYQPDQPLLLPPDLQEWVPPGHLAHHVSDVVDALDLTAFYAPYEGDGRRNAPYEPSMMVKVLLYAYATGTFSSRAVARKLEEDVAFRMLAAGNFPQHRTVCEFRRRHLGEFSELFVQVVQVAREMGLARFSDMTTNVILGDLLRFNERVLKELDVPTYFIRLSLPNGGHFETSLPRNPFIRELSPVVLVPTDILRHLPIATDWSEVADAASKNQQLRNRVNRDIAMLWTRTSRKDKGELRLWAMSGKDEFETFLEMIRAAGARGYDTATDPQGVLTLQRIGAALAADEPLTIEKPATLDVDGVAKVVLIPTQAKRNLSSRSGIGGVLSAT